MIHEKLDEWTIQPVDQPCKLLRPICQQSKKDHNTLDPICDAYALLKSTAHKAEV